VENQLEQRKLWSALSDLFVDAKVDYKQIAEALKDFSIEEIEFALFERVAPVCIGNMLAPIPPIWWYFDEDQLASDIEALIRKRARQGVIGKCACAVQRCLIRRIGSSTWAELKAEIETAKAAIGMTCRSQ
jgi:hypothetical protein